MTLARDDVRFVARVLPEHHSVTPPEPGLAGAPVTPRPRS